jgi:hypothetical protein
MPRKNVGTSCHLYRCATFSPAAVVDAARCAGCRARITHASANARFGWCLCSPWSRFAPSAQCGCRCARWGCAPLEQCGCRERRRRKGPVLFQGLACQDPDAIDHPISRDGRGCDGLAARVLRRTIRDSAPHVGLDPILEAVRCQDSQGNACLHLILMAASLSTLLPAHAAVLPLLDSGHSEDGAIPLPWTCPSSFLLATPQDSDAASAWHGR